MSTTLVQPPDPERGRARLQREQLRLLFALLPVALMFSAMVATVVAVSLWRAGSTAGLVPWAAAFVVVAGARLGLLVAYRRLSEAPEDPLPWLRFSLVGAFLSGCVWGGAIVFLMPGGTPLNETLLVIAVAGIAAGAVTTLAPVWLLTVAFVVPAVLPVVIVFAAQGRYGIAGTAALFLAGLLVVGRRQAAIFGESVRLRLDLADSEAALRDREARYRLIFQSAPLGIFSFDRDTTITDCNEEFADILGASREQLLGLNMARDLRDAQVKTAVQRCLQYGSGEYEGDYEPVVGSRTTPVRALFRALRGEDGAAVGGVAVVEDFSERRRAAAIIEHQANYDPLTDLPNRRLLLARIDEVLAARQEDGGSAGLVFLDLDHFKRINDSLGHAVGDRLLRAVAPSGRQGRGATTPAPARRSSHRAVAASAAASERGTQRTDQAPSGPTARHTEPRGRTG
ncbi:MAG: diguanylate cyclase, partial [Ectothiorhodospiraceae bacterium]